MELGGAKRQAIGGTPAQFLPSARVVHPPVPALELGESVRHVDVVASRRGEVQQGGPTSGDQSQAGYRKKLAPHMEVGPHPRWSRRPSPGKGAICLHRVTGGGQREEVVRPVHPLPVPGIGQVAQVGKGEVPVGEGDHGERMGQVGVLKQFLQVLHMVGEPHVVVR